jgi:nucleoside 2-deoxyribosyltransferase
MSASATERPLAIIGEVLVDVVLDPPPTRMRLGGVVHAMRMAWALDHPFTAVCVVPPGIEEEVVAYIRTLDPINVVILGHLRGAPGVIVARRADEADSQGYELLMRETKRLAIDTTVALDVAHDLLVIGDSTFLDAVSAHLARLRTADSALYIDIDVAPIDAVAMCGRIDGFFTSTSAQIFATHVEPIISEPRRADLHPDISSIIMKENRGGSQLISRIGNAEVGSFPIVSQHSIGVGDAFDVAYIASSSSEVVQRMAFASLAASCYAASTDPDRLRELVSAARTIAQPHLLPSVRVPWIGRPDICVYLAAPDFAHVDTKRLDEIESALRYHNFSCARPVQMNGEADASADAGERERIFQQDLELLLRSDLMIAVPLYRDPGTYAEVGVAAASKIDVVMYDPDGITDNLFVDGLVTRWARTVDEVIDAVFELAAARP